MFSIRDDPRSTFWRNRVRMRRPATHKPQRSRQAPPRLARFQRPLRPVFYRVGEKLQLQSGPVAVIRTRSSTRPAIRRLVARSKRSVLDRKSVVWERWLIAVVGVG